MQDKRIIETHISFSFQNTINDKKFSFHLFENFDDNKKLLKWLRMVSDNPSYLDKTASENQDANDICPISSEHIKHFHTETKKSKIVIHGYNMGSIFYIVRIDPKHKFHK